MAAPPDIADAERLVEEGDSAGAQAIAEALLAEAPGDPGALNVLGFIAHREGRLIDAQRAFERACAHPDADDDARANLAAVRQELGRIYATAAPAAPAPAAAAAAHDPAGQFDFAGTLEDLAEWQLNGDISPRLLGRLLGAALGGSLEDRLNELPSATKREERRLLFRLAARFWDGRHDVFENGPLLGGTTRALALGMLANPARNPKALLHTHDWFSSRQPLDIRPDQFEAMIDAGLLPRRHHDEMLASGTFKPLFDALHAGQDYSELVRSHVAYLPGRPGDVPPGGEAVFAAPPANATFSLVFVDGCKSWYGTRHWIRTLAPHVGRGTPFVFQDYGWYTCFWLPALVLRLPEHFRLLAHVRDTYVFELVRPLDADRVDERFPEDPADLGRAELGQLFTRGLMDAGLRGDTHAMVALTIQHAASLAWIGERDEARARIADLRGRPEFAAFDDYVDGALKSPTYTPEGPILL